MKLTQLLDYNNILIQCHDNPDADAIASGYALYRFFKEQKKDVHFVYSGRFPISKNNLKLMISDINIPIDYVKDMDEVKKLSDGKTPDILVTTDCQYGQGNVTKLEFDNVAVIDHHQVSGELPEKNEVRSNIGSCSTVVWDMIRKTDSQVLEDSKLGTALYYGLFTDTNGFAEISHPLDRDLVDEIPYRNSLITKFRNSNLSQKELQIAGRALLDYDYNEKHKSVIAETEPCDPNILGLISDMLLEVDTVNVALVYSILQFGVKLSVRSCVKEAKANEFTEYIVDGVGNGGGHLIKSGGFIAKEKLEEFMEYTPENIRRFLEDRVSKYFDETDIIYAGKYTAEISSMKPANKKQFKLGYVEVKDLGIQGNKAEVRTLEGDIEIKVEPDTYIMIGIEGEIYPINKTKFERGYSYIDEPYIYEFDYEPALKEVSTGRSVSIIPKAHSCLSTGKARIFVKELDRRVKIFTSWDPEKYYLGKPGDFMAVREDDPSDVYIIARDIFFKSYDME